MNPRMMKQAMKKMGIKQIEVPATEVIIKCPDKDIVITDPQVSKVNMMGQQTYQIVGQEHEREKQIEVTISEEDIKTVAEQAGVDQEKAKEALEQAKGDLAEAIMNLKQ